MYAYTIIINSDYLSNNIFYLMDLKEILRNNSGLIGETTRVLTEYYYNSLYETNLENRAENLILYRNSLYELHPTVKELSLNEVFKIKRAFKNNLPAIMLIFFYLECYPESQFQQIIDENLDVIYIVSIEEHKRVADSLGKNPIVENLSDYQANLLKEILDDRY